ncbi:ThiF family adenylyltransferase [Tuwongella immobilis]|uniref:THIF-type NAD/FAD binding fold domain-containing protein n=1 Tax=Tuwongella immobilis TaxID=692036 RepID=A0A6C2YKX8_9BACT|nr:ThiF family adenylyltransferase [Tuwongella immobilis]VIP02034.1 thif family protein : Hypothetical conserved protein OS=uncultured planctomycete GN=HGMM_F33C03C23 PE=4 SV=1: ThiF [Tuwongella immobilis]VTS00189.1 thif family protein : Hypothetical conserved protein OS=uncultured planctomycete GN=HGMM_F33C03C23 PE=4 SV=1: ThiF [Tuwongella immobilis]
MAHLFQVGAGSGGMVVLDLLCRDPRITTITLVEPDIYKPHNAARHYFPASAAGQLKVDLVTPWIRDRRPDIHLQILPTDLLDPQHQATYQDAIAACDLGICAVDVEPAKYRFDALFRQAGKPWTMGEVLSGGIGGWVHRFSPGQACYGCVASHLQRNVREDASPPPDYSNPDAVIAETTIPASVASIHSIASLHANVSSQLLPDGGDAGDDWTSILLTLQSVPNVFREAYRTYRFSIARRADCLICGESQTNTLSGDALDSALDAALNRLGAD